jgi:hypothetical protein
MDADIGELLRDLNLLLESKGDARSLFPVPKGGIENSDLTGFVAVGEEDNTPRQLSPRLMLCES